jgi:hypothetical protein
MASILGSYQQEHVLLAVCMRFCVQCIHARHNRVASLCNLT